MSSASTCELIAPEERATPDEPEIYHLYCVNAPRNVPEVTVMCCGLPVELAGEEGKGTVPCPLCCLADEMDFCACWDAATDRAA